MGAGHRLQAAAFRRRRPVVAGILPSIRPRRSFLIPLYPAVGQHPGGMSDLGKTLIIAGKNPLEYPAAIVWPHRDGDRRPSDGCIPYTIGLPMIHVDGACTGANRTSNEMNHRDEEAEERGARS
jgi:hypothetical protein